MMMFFQKTIDIPIQIIPWIYSPFSYSQHQDYCIFTVANPKASDHHLLPIASRGPAMFDPYNTRRPVGGRNSQTVATSLKLTATSPLKIGT